MITLKVNCDKLGISQAAQIIKDGGIVVFPTDTVYGIGCNPYSKEAVDRVYRIKSRQSTKSVPVLTYSLDTAQKIAEFDELAKKIVKRFWPGPLTVILPVTDEKIKESLNLNKKIAIRVPDNNCTLELLKECNYLVGTSANVSGDTPHVNPEECMKNLQGYDVLIDGGVISGGVESTIIEIQDGQIKIVRQGSLTQDEILQV